MDSKKGLIKWLELLHYNGIAIVKNAPVEKKSAFPILNKIGSIRETFFKTPLAVNNCIEGMLGPTYANHEDYGAGLVLSELLTFNYLVPLIREKGGAYGAGCAMNESGIINFYSFRDPKIG